MQNWILHLNWYENCLICSNLIIEYIDTAHDFSECKLGVGNLLQQCKILKLGKSEFTWIDQCNAALCTADTSLEAWIKFF